MDNEKEKLDQARAASKKSDADKMQPPDEGNAEASSSKLTADQGAAEKFSDAAKRR